MLQVTNNKRNVKPTVADKRIAFPQIVPILELGPSVLDLRVQVYGLSHVLWNKRNESLLLNICIRAVDCIDSVDSRARACEPIAVGKFIFPRNQRFPVGGVALSICPAINEFVAVRERRLGIKVYLLTSMCPPSTTLR